MAAMSIGKPRPTGMLREIKIRRTLEENFARLELEQNGKPRTLVRTRRKILSIADTSNLRVPLSL